MTRCDEPVRVPGVFSATETDTGHRCQRVAGHDGPHRWQARWAGLPPEQVEAEIARDLAEWEPPDDEAEPPAS
jgi:hypothetical protein